jgi:hypothetical protein
VGQAKVIIRINDIKQMVGTETVLPQQAAIFIHMRYLPAIGIIISR